MPDPRNPSFDDVPHEAYLDPYSFVEAIQNQEEQSFTEADEDRGLWGFATLLLAGIGGYALLKHFPPGRIASVVDEIKNVFKNPRSLGASSGTLDKIKTAFNRASQVTLKQPWASANKEEFSRILATIRVADDPDILRGFEGLAELAEKNPQSFANVNAIQKVVTAPHRGAVSAATLGDIFDPLTGLYKTDTWGTMPKQLSKLQNVLTRLAEDKIPGLKQTTKLWQARVNPGLYIDRSNPAALNLIDRRRWSPSNWLYSIRKAAANTTSPALNRWGNPFAVGVGTTLGLMAGYDENDAVSTIAGALGGAALGSIPLRHLARSAKWASELLTPTELLTKAADIGVFGPSLIKRYAGVNLSGASGAIVSFGQLIPVFGETAPQLGSVVAKGLRIGKSATAMGQTAANAARERFLTKRLARLGKTRGEEYLRDLEAETGKAPGAVYSALVKFGDLIGVGPQYRRGAAPGIDPDAPLEQPIPSMLVGLFMDPARTVRSTVMGAFKRLAGKEAATKTGAAELYVYRPLEGLKDFANFHLNRVGHLFEQTTGLGMKFGETVGESAKRWLGVAIGGAAAWETLKYVDYASRQMIGTGPLSAPLQAYTAIRNTQQHLLAATGIQQTAAYLENLMPGLVSSPLSALVRTSAVFRLFRGKAPFGFFGATKFGQKAAETLNLEAKLGVGWGRAAAGAIAATQLTDITESPAHLAAVYRGEIDVPVREGRYWFLGTQPYGGGRITHTRPHLIPTILGHSREIGLYGSEKGYWKAQLGLPVPENWFGLRPLLFPYETEQRNYSTRPTPLTGGFVGLAGNLPLIGPMVNATVGELLKPTQRWHADAYQAESTLAPSVGMSPIRGELSVRDPTHILSAIGKQIDMLRDFVGMPGFMLGAIKRMVTGDPDFYAPNRELATGSYATSTERSYYDMQLGGALGMTELLRRMIPHRRRSTDIVNPVINQTPDWLPGIGSAFELDRSFYLDMHRGDPYARLIAGEARLPGPGYEAIHRLHSGIPGVYDAYDRWRILRDIAPTSQAFRHYDTLVRSWAAVASKGPTDGSPFRRSFDGIVRHVLDGDTVVVDVNGKLVTVRIEGGDTPETEHDAWTNLIEEQGAIGLNRASRKGRKAIDPTRAEEGLAATAALRAAAIDRPATVQVTDIDLYGRAVGRLKVRGGAGTIDVSQQLSEAYPGYDLSALEQAQVASSRDYLRKRFEPYPFTNRIFSDIGADVPRNMRDLTTSSLSAINKAKKEYGAFTLPEKVIGNLWERISHVNLPGPLNWPVNKFFAQRDPLEIYRRDVLMGGKFAQWETPIQSYIVPWAHQTVGFFDKDYVPGRLKAQRAAVAEIDAFEYVRNRQFAAQATLRGEGAAAQIFTERSRRTMANVILTGNMRYARSALPRTERGFYDAFAGETSPERRGSILSNVSPQMGAILRQSWGIASRGDLASERALVGRASGHPAGLHPDITANMLKVKVSHDRAWDFHEMGLSQQDNYVTEEIFSDAFEIPIPPTNFATSTHARSINMANRMGLQTPTIMTEESLFAPSVSTRLSTDSRRYRRLLKTYGMPSQGMRF